MDSSIVTFGGKSPLNNSSAAVCRTLDDYKAQYGDPIDPQEPRRSQSGLVSGGSVIQDDPLACRASNQDRTVPQDSQGLSITVEDTIVDTTIVNSSDGADRRASERVRESLERVIDCLVRDLVAAAADVELEGQAAKKEEAGGLDPRSITIAAIQPPTQHTAEDRLMIQTAGSNSSIECGVRMIAGGSQDEIFEDKRILHQQARKALAAVRKAQTMAAEAAPDFMMSFSDEAQCASAIAEWDGLHKQLALSLSQHQEQSSLLQIKVKEREREATELQSQYKDSLGSLLREAVDPKTGKSIPVARVTALEQSLLLKEHAADTARFRVLYLHAKLRRLQEQQKSRGTILGLHLVDFEQLKVENAHLSDKIEDRRRQLANVQNKSHAALNVLAHVKEKYHREKIKNAELQATMAKAQEQLKIDKERARFAVKQHLKRKATQMKLREAEVLQDPTLMANFQELLVVREQWTSKVALLREQHAASIRAP